MVREDVIWDMWGQIRWFDCVCYCPSAAINGHSECLRLLIHNTDQQTAVSMRDGKGQWVTGLLYLRCMVEWLWDCWSEHVCVWSGLLWCWRFWVDTQIVCIFCWVKEPVWRPEINAAGRPSTAGSVTHTDTCPPLCSFTLSIYLFLNETCLYFSFKGMTSIQIKCQ